MLLGTPVLVLIFMGYSAATLLNDAASGELHSELVLVLLSLNTLIALEVLLPTAMFFATVYGLTRLYRDSEMAALFALGIGELRVLRAVLIFSLAVATLAGAISIYGRPWAYNLSYTLEERAASDLNVDRLEDGHFHALGDGRLVLVADRTDARRHRVYDVFVQRHYSESARIIIAREADIPRWTPGEQRTITFFNGYAYWLDRHGSLDRTLKFNELLFKLTPDDVEPVVRNKRKAQPTEILATSNEPKDIAEFQWRLSAPLTTVLLGILAVPLSRSVPRQGIYVRMIGAIGVYAVYFNLDAVARTWVENKVVGAMPGIWWAPILLLVLGLLLLRLPRFA